MPLPTSDALTNMLAHEESQAASRVGLSPSPSPVDFASPSGLRQSWLEAGYAGSLGSIDTSQARVERAVEKLLKRSEAMLGRYKQERLDDWREEVLQSLRAAEAQDGASEPGLRAKAVAKEAEAVRAAINERRWALEEVRLAGAEKRRKADEIFAAELREAGEACRTRSHEALLHAAEQLRHSLRQWEAEAPDRLSRALDAANRRQQRRAHVAQPGLGIAAAHAAGTLMPKLAAESERWNEMQRQDVAQLQAEVSAEFDSVISELDEQLRNVLPQALAERPWQRDLQQINTAAVAKVQQAYEELSVPFLAELRAVEQQIHEDFHGYDAELQRILIEGLEARSRSNAKIRELKIAMCRWRLDYQKVYHDRYDALMQKAEKNGGALALAPPSSDVGRARFAAAKRLVQKLWEQGKVHPADAQALLASAAEASARAGIGQRLRAQLEEELLRTPPSSGASAPASPLAQTPSGFQPRQSQMTNGSAPRRSAREAELPPSPARTRGAASRPSGGSQRASTHGAEAGGRLSSSSQRPPAHGAAGGSASKRASLRGRDKADADSAGLDEVDLASRLSGISHQSSPHTGEAQAPRSRGASAPGPQRARAAAEKRGSAAF